jgi:hypothetical protein
MPKHELHIAVANAINKILNTLVCGKPEFEIKKDEAADDSNGPKQHLSFFLPGDPKRESGVSKVDIIIVKKGVVKLACEIEESGFNPTKIFGKVFSTAAANTCRLYKLKEHTHYKLDKVGVFVEVLSSDKMLARTKNQKNTKKFIQGDLIQTEINGLLSNSSSWLQHYHLLFGEKADFDSGGKCYLKLEEIIKKLQTDSSTL